MFERSADDPTVFWDLSRAPITPDEVWEVQWFHREVGMHARALRARPDEGPARRGRRHLPGRARRSERPGAHRPRNQLGTAYWIGSGAGADAPATLGATDLHALVTVGRTEVGVRLVEGMRAEVEIDGAWRPLERWQEEQDRRVLPEGARLRLQLGGDRFVVSRGGRTPRLRSSIPARLRSAAWWAERSFGLAVAAAFLALLLIARALPPDARALSLPARDHDRRYLAFRIVPLEARPSLAALLRGARRGPENPGRRPDSGGPQPSEAPAVARRSRRPGPAATAPPRVVAPRVRAAPPGKELLHQAARLAEIRRTGLLGILRGDRRDQLQRLADGAGEQGFSSLVGQLITSSPVAADDPDEVLRGLMPAPSGSMYGVGGLGPAGSGVAGGGDGDDLAGDGGLRTLAGDGPGAGGSDHPYGREAGRLARRRPRPPAVTPGEVTARGGLDREIIRRVIRRQINQIRYCYERELPARPDLGGRVALTFTISPNGRVAAALIQTSTLAHPRAEACLLDAARRWIFPAPAGGGVVVATYPFNFVAAGAGE